MSDPFEALLQGRTDHARERRVHGLVTARVGTIEPDGSYRLEYLTMGDEAPSARARVMTPMAGDGRGVHFLPEPGDEVVVAFELGDTSRPIVLGSLWNRESPRPTQANASPDNHVRTIVSRSGHEITLDDTPGREKVVLKSKGGHEVTLDDTPGLGKITARTAVGRELALVDGPVGGVALRSLTGAIQLSDAGGTAQVQASGPVQVSAPTISLTGTAVSIVGVLTINGLPFQAHVHLPPGPPGVPPAPFTGPPLSP